LKEYLNSYIKRIENRLLAGGPVAENPRIHSIAKGTVKKSGIVLMAAFIISVVAAFLHEGIKNRKEVVKSK